MSSNVNSRSKKKQKEAKDLFKKIFITILFSLLIVLMILSLIPAGLNSLRGASVNFTPLVEVNGDMFNNQPYMVFDYINTEIYNSFNEQYGDYYSSDIIGNLAVNQSVELLLNYALLSDFAKEQDIVTSPAVYSSYLQMWNTPSLNQGMRKYVDFKHADNALNSYYGDIESIGSTMTVAELYSYLELADFSAQSEVLYIDITNYIADKITDELIETYFNDNLDTYASEIYVDDIMVTNKQLSKDILEFANTNGWDSALAEYEGQYLLENNVLLSNVRGTEKRYEIAMVLETEGIASNSVYENSAYHVVKLNRFQSFDELSDDLKEYLKSVYTYENYDDLKEEYIGNIRLAMEQADTSAKNNNNFQSIADEYSIEYVKTGYFTPVNLILPDEDGNELELPILDTTEIMDFIFTAEVGDVSDKYEVGDYILIVKSSYLGDNPEIDNSYTDLDILQKYNRFKSGMFDYSGQRYQEGAVYKDWMDNLMTNSQFEVFEEEIATLFD